MLLSLEGIDGAGKATAVKNLVPVLKSATHGGAPVFNEVETFDFPHYQGRAGQYIHKMLRGELPAEPLVLQSLMTIDRFEHGLMLKSFKDDPYRALILDRYYLSGICYGLADGLDEDWLRQIHALLPSSDVTFLLDISVEESVKRRPERRDFYELNLDKLNRVRNLYLKECADADEAVVVDGTKHPLEVTAVMLTHVVTKAVRLQSDARIVARTRRSIEKAAELQAGF